MFDALREYIVTMYHAFLDGSITYPSLKEVVSRTLEVFRAPTANPVATVASSLFLLNIFAILLVIILWIVLKAHDDRVLREQREEFNELLREKDPENADEIIREANVESRWFMIVASILTFFVLLVGINVGTAQNRVCVSCHKDTAHEQSIVKGAHKDASCVSCHEPSGVMARTVTSLFPRIVHIVQGSRVAQEAQSESTAGNSDGVYTSSDGVTVDTNALSKAVSSTYGGVSSQACSSCHENANTETLTNDTAGIRVRHKDFLTQGAKCTDCHTVNSSTGQIVYTQKMDACLTCHNGEDAASQCTTCHTKSFDTASAERSKPRVGVEHDLTMNCYSCHDTARCDACHGGVRMPHSEDFMTTGLHAYDAAQALWSGSTKCSKCHPLKTDCNTKCHGILPYHYSTDKNFAKTHIKGMFDNKNCGLCHYDFNPKGTKGTTLSEKHNSDSSCDSCHSTKGASAGTANP